MNSKDIRIVLTGGGSAGHIAPLLSVVEELQKIAPDSGLFLDLHYIGPKDEFSQKLTDIGVKVHSIPSAKLRRYFSLQNILDVPKFIIAIVLALFKMLANMPDVVFSKGGTSALPVVLAAWLYRVPILIHESDATPGLTNLLSARFATRIAVGFEGALKIFRTDAAAVTGNPVRSSLLSQKLSKPAAKTALGFDPEQPLIAVLGGSQGATSINEFIIANLSSLLSEAAVFHQTGEATFSEMQKLGQVVERQMPAAISAIHPYRPVAYTNEISRVYCAADLIIARAGASTITEASAFGVPSILIPLPENASNGHQRLNAFEYAKTGAAIVVEQENLLPGIFLRQVKHIISDPAEMDKMSRAALSFYRPDAAKNLAEEVLRLGLGQY
jgi:UDP-N-acetylglucosamine--N-acetylmuramyl-(pentapeptide) pyrophosphoryl-undecaprenol N-acetylglucosamine transferase